MYYKYSFENTKTGGDFMKAKEEQIKQVFKDLSETDKPKPHLIKNCIFAFIENNLYVKATVIRKIDYIIYFLLEININLKFVFC